MYKNNKKMVEDFDRLDFKFDCFSHLCKTINIFSISKLTFLEYVRCEGIQRGSLLSYYSSQCEVAPL